MILVQSTADLPNRIANYAAGTFAVVRAGGNGETVVPNCNSAVTGVIWGLASGWHTLWNRDWERQYHHSPRYRCYPNWSHITSVESGNRKRGAAVPRQQCHIDEWWGSLVVQRNERVHDQTHRPGSWGDSGTP